MDLGQILQQMSACSAQSECTGDSWHHHVQPYQTRTVYVYVLAEYAKHQQADGAYYCCKPYPAVLTPFTHLLQVLPGGQLKLCAASQYATGRTVGETFAGHAAMI